MDIITIEYRFLRDLSIGIKVTTDSETYEVEMEDPYDASSEALLEYYFEEYINKPYDDVPIKAVPEILGQYGENLFHSVFPDKISKKIGSAKDKSKLIIDIVGDLPAFHAIFWEAMKPIGGRPLAQEGVIFRRRNINNLKNENEQAIQVYASINLLLVTCRPDEENDVNVRTVQRPLVEILDSIDAKVNIHILRPGTFDAFIDHLRDKIGYYHLVHFDLHGGLLNYKSYSKMHFFAVGRHQKLKPLLPKLEEALFEGGKRGFVFFETETKGISAPIEASQIAEILDKYQINVVILNACQSAKQDFTENETSMASILSKKGTSLVLAMRYSISVSAVRIFMKRLYEQLYRGRSFYFAVSDARIALSEDTRRQALFNRYIYLEDWMLPVVYINENVSFRLNSLSKQDQQLPPSMLSEKIKLDLDYGFYGRDLDILKIEKGLLTQNNILLLQSMGGAGKTTLLKYLAGWWLKTGFIAKAFYFGYDLRGYLLEEILMEIGQSIWSEEELTGNLYFAASIEALESEVIDYLTKHPCALILDNTEAITGQKLAIRNALPDAEKIKIKGFLNKLKGGKTFVLIGSRSSEDWLREHTFGDNHYLLHGLDRVAAANLIESILGKNNLNISNYKDDPYFERLIKLLDGSPLALKAILPNLKNKSPQQIIEELSVGLRDLDKGNIQQRTESIYHCIEYAFENLSEDAQQVLLYFAPFSGLVNKHSDLFYTFLDQLKIMSIRYSTLGKPLDKLQFFMPESFDLVNIHSVIKEAKENGLAQEFILNDHKINIIQLQPVFAYFLRHKLENQLEVFNNHLNFTYKKYIYKKSETYSQWIEADDPKLQNKGLANIEVDFENLYNVLSIQIKSKGRIFSLVSTLDEYLKKKRLHSKRIEILKFVEEGLRVYDSSEMDETVLLEHVFVLDRLADVFITVRDFERSDIILKQLTPLVKKCSLSKREKAFLRACVDERIGEIALEKEDLKKARKYIETALVTFKKHKSYLDIALAKKNLGIICVKQGDHAKAEAFLTSALKVFQEKGAKYNQAGIFQNLGMLFEEKLNFEEADNYYQKAIQIFDKFNDGFSIAMIYVNLGNIRHREGDLSGAKTFYLDSIEIFEQYKEWYQQANPFYNLGLIAQEQKEWNIAEGYYQKALSIFRRYHHFLKEAGTLLNLGTLYQDIGEYEKALRFFHDGLAVSQEYKDLKTQSQFHYNIGNIFQIQQEAEKAIHQYDMSINLAKQSGEVEVEANASHNLGLLLIANRSLREGLRLLQHSLKLFRQQDDFIKQATVYNNMGRLFMDLGEFEAAANCYLFNLITWLEQNNKEGVQLILEKIDIILKRANNPELTKTINQELENIFSKVLPKFNQ